ncbi:MAG TPA: ribonuclease HII [Candidatus Paceibacterota bacterium]|nr:ribonuclease HII [Candidatus Paceibacterota bacterium]
MKSENGLKMDVFSPRYIVGVDEAGRGPLAGPVAVGAVVVSHDFDWALLPGVDDSKRVPAVERLRIYGEAKALKASGVLDYAVSLVAPSVIDRAGIVRAVARGISRSLSKLALDPTLVEVRLDGLLRAPRAYGFQRTIVGGDGLEKVIGLASIMAKVTRDRFMERVARRYPHYGFDAHKGYGTPEHRKAILEHDLCPLHRRSYCTRFTVQNGLVEILDEV